MAVIKVLLSLSSSVSITDKVGAFVCGVSVGCWIKDSSLIVVSLIADPVDSEGAGEFSNSGSMVDEIGEKDEKEED